MNEKKITEQTLKEKIDKITLWKDAAKDEYIIRRKEMDSADNKLHYMLLFNFTIFSFFIQFIRMPEMIYGVIFYILTSVLYVISILLLVGGLCPKKINTINFESNEKNDLFDELRTLKCQYATACDENSNVIDSKLKYLTGSTGLFLIALFFTMILSLVQRG